MARLDSAPMSLPKSAFLLPAGIAAAALALFLWPVPEPPPLPPVEMSAAPKLHFAAHDELAASPRDAYAPIPMLRARPDRAIGAVRDLGGAVKENTELRALSDEERKQIQTGRMRLEEQFKELETVAAKTTFDGDTKTGHVRFIRLQEPCSEHLGALYDAGTAEVAKFADGSPAYDAMRQEVAKLVADYSQPRVLYCHTKTDGQWVCSVITGNPETISEPDEEGMIKVGGGHKNSMIQGTGDMAADPKTERYWHLLKH